MNKFIYLSSIGLIAISSQVVAVHADETAGEKVQNAAGDAKTDAKKDVRTATGNDSIGKDAKDKANDVGDDISNNADKVDRKVSQ
jgi:hypothetical protein